MGLGGVSPWAFRHRSLLKTRLGSTLWRNSQSCLAGPSNPPENKMAAVGSTKRLPWSHNDILRLVKAPPLSSSVLPSRQQYRMWDYPGTPPPSVYQVTHGTALQAAECYVQQYILMRMNYHITRTQYTLLCLEGNHITSTPQALRCLEGTTLSNRGQRPRYR